MNQRVLKLIRAVLTLVVNGLPIMLIYMLSTDLICNEIGVTFEKTAGIFLWIPIFLFYLYREVIQKSFVFLGLHLITMASYYFLFRRNIIDSVFLALFLIGFLIYSIALRVNGKNSKVFHPAFLLGFVTVEYFISSVAKHIEGTFVIYCLIAGIIAYYVQYYLVHFAWFIITRSSVNEEIPEKDLFRSGEKYTGVYLLGTSLILLLVSQIKELNQFGKKLLYILRDFIGIVLRFLASLFPKKAPVQEIVVQETIESMVEEGNFELPPEENVLLQTILNILFVLIAIAVIAGLLYMLGKAFAQLMEALNRKGKVREGKDIEDKLDKSEKIKAVKKAGYEERSRRFFLSSSEKIRKIYAQVVAGNGKLSLSKEKQIYRDPSKTVRELMLVFDEEKYAYAEELTNLYELARYHDHACSSLEVKRAKELSKLLK